MFARIALVTACLLVVVPASADAGERARAERLFREGSEALEKGRIDEACTKLAESAALYRALGTEYNLGTCFEMSHRTASAKRAYLRAAAIARQSNKESIAKDAYARARKMDAVTPKLVVKAPADATLLCDGNPIVAGDTIELDPGTHLVKATAKGKPPFDQRVELAEGDTREVSVAFASEDAPPVSKAEERSPAAPPSRADLATIVGVAAGAVGLAALGVGAYFTLHAKSEKDDSGCRDGRFCPDPSAAARLSDAKADANVATAFVATGGVLVAAGAVLFFVDPFDWRPASRTGFAPVIGPGAFGVRWAASW